MAFNGTGFDYSESDVAGATINGITKGIIAAGSFVAIIVLVALYRYVRKKL